MTFCRLRVRLRSSCESGANAVDRLRAHDLCEPLAFHSVARLGYNKRMEDKTEDHTSRLGSSGIEQPCGRLPSATYRARYSLL